MEQELDYAEMLEIPVSTVNVVKKKSFFKRNPFAREKKEQVEQVAQQEDLKELVVDSVNERVGAYVYAEDLSEPAKPEKKHRNAISFGKDRGSMVLIAEFAAVCLIAVAIFLTNIFMPSSAINTFISGVAGSTAPEPAYTEFKLSAVVSERSEAVVSVSDSGVLSFTAKGSVYPICSGTVSSVAETDGTYTVQISHTSTFKSVITGLTDVYSAKGTKVQGNIPFAYSDGENEVHVSMYDGETLLNCYTLSDEVPVWKS